jgi:hypothetical protein
MPKHHWAILVALALAIPFGCSRSGKETVGRAQSNESLAKDIQASLAAAEAALRGSSELQVPAHREGPAPTAPVPAVRMEGM